MSELLTVGETMARLSSPTVGRLRHASSLDLGVAGAESNVAIGFTRLGGRATWVGRVGDDELGALVTASVRGAGVEAVAIVDPDRPTGLMFKERRSAEVGRVVYYRADSAGSRLRPADVDEALLDRAAVVHLTGVTTAISASARETAVACAQGARDRGHVVSFDLNYRAGLWSPDEARPVLTDMVRRSDVVFCTADEARLLVDGSEPAELAAAVASLGPRQVVVKRAELGSVAWIEGAVHQIDAVAARVLDPVGAGDAFAAGYLFELTRGADATVRLETGTRAGAYAVTVAGDWEGAPSYAELADLDGDGDAVHR